MNEVQTESPDTLRPSDWAGAQGENWLANLDRFEGMIAPVGKALLARAGYAPGERVVDIGCGGGATTIDIARAVGPEGLAIGLDISPALVEAAGARAAATGLGNLSFQCGDAAEARPLQAPFDRLHSRFGSMFFTDPAAAFANLRAMLAPGGRADLAVWAPARDNGWITQMMALFAAHVTLPPPVPNAPGPFAFGDLDYLRGVLAAAGWSAPDIESWEGLLPIGGVGATPDEAAAFATTTMAFGEALKAAGPEVAARVVEEVKQLFARHHVPGQGVMLPGKVWLVTTRA